MSGMQLTYDTRQDRVLLTADMGLELPSWWLTRRMLARLMADIQGTLKAKYETDNVLRRLNETVSKDSVSEQPNEAEGADFDSYHEDKRGDSNMSVQASAQGVENVVEFPLASAFKIEFIGDHAARVMLFDVTGRGISLDFHEQGLHRFCDMLMSVAKRSDW